MKLVKMSIAAAVLLGASAFAIDNVKVDGDAKLYYGTNNAGSNSLFSKGAAVNSPSAVNTGAAAGTTGTGGSSADVAVRVGVTGDLMKGVSFGLTGYGVTTLGLENNLVGQTWTGAHAGAGSNSQFGHDVKDQAWLGEAWLAASMGKSTAKLGRMALDTPLAFSETWSVVPNTFEAAVLINQDLPDTTLVGAWVGKGNGTSVAGLGNAAATYAGGALGMDSVVAGGAAFNTFMNSGAYAAAIVNNSFKPLTAQAWYYNVVNIADAYWLQGDIACSLVKDLKIGAQYANMSPKGATLGAVVGIKDSSAYAVKLGYEGVQNLKVSAAYSSADKDGTLKIANVGTNNLGTSQSKLYTESFWNYGYVGAAGADSYNVVAEYNAGIATVGAQYTNVSNKKMTGTVESNHDLSEIALSASKDFGPLNATLAYFSTDAKDQNVKTVGANGSRYDSVLAMLKLKF